MSSSVLFQKVEQRPYRTAIVLPFSKTTPSKWDDAHKWIKSPTTNRHSKAGASSKKTAFLGHGNKLSASKVILEVMEEVDTKRIHPSQVKNEPNGQKTLNWETDLYPVTDFHSKAPLFDNSFANSTISLRRHDSSKSVQSTTTVITPPPIVRSVSMRDMGTEMTPIASQEPSRTGTPARAATPMLSPATSRPSTPGITVPCSTPIKSAECQEDSSRRGLSEKETQMKTRKEIMVLGAQLGKPNIASWACKEEEDKDPIASIKAISVDQPTESVVEIRAAAWEEAEKAKYLARFKRKEINIQAWENHQKAKTEAKMRKFEVKVEKMRAGAHDKLMNELAAARHKAEKKHASAEAKRNQQAAKTAQKAEFMRRTGRFPSSFSCWSCCSTNPKC